MKKLSEIQKQYRDVGDADCEMSQDMRTLLTYLERLHEELVRRSSQEALQRAAAALEGMGDQRHVH